MQKEIIVHNDKKVTKTIKNDGSVSYSQKSVYLGIDSKTGKPVKTTITAKTLRALDRKIVTAKLDFEKYGSTRKEQVKITNLKDLAEVWFVSFETWASSENTLNRVQGYLSTYIIPRFGEYQPNKIEPSDIQIWVNELALNAQNSLNSGKNYSEKGKAIYEVE